MRFLLALPALLLFTACAEIQTVANPTHKLPAGAAITVHMVGVEGAGLEHAIIQTLSEEGFDVRSQGPLSMLVKPEDGNDAVERVMRYDTPYVCRIKTMGRSSLISYFSLQVIHVSTGRVLISQAGQDGSWTASEVARALQAALK